MCICVCMYACIFARMYVYAYMCVCVYVCIYMYMHTRVSVHMHSCRRICLFVLSNPSTTCVCITGVFSTLTCVCGGGLEVGVFLSLFMLCACCWRGRLCFDRGRDRGFVS